MTQRVPMEIVAELDSEKYRVAVANDTKDATVNGLLLGRVDGDEIVELSGRVVSSRKATQDERNALSEQLRKQTELIAATRARHRLF